MKYNKYTFDKIFPRLYFYGVSAGIFVSAGINWAFTTNSAFNLGMGLFGLFGLIFTTYSLIKITKEQKK